MTAIDRVPTVVLAAAYQQLLDSTTSEELPTAVSFRARELDPELDLFQELADRHAAADEATSGFDSYSAAEHLLPFCWVLAAGHSTESGTAKVFEGQVRREVAERIDRLGWELEHVPRIVFTGWTPGLLLADAGAPRWPQLISDAAGPDILLAFEGLQRYLEAIGEGDQPELALNAVVWRSAALIEATSTANGLGASCRHAVSRLEGALATSDWNEFQALAEDFSEVRHALSHIHDNEGGGFSFSTTYDRYTNRESMSTLGRSVSTLVHLYTAEQLSAMKVEDARRQADGLLARLEWVGELA